MSEKRDEFLSEEDLDLRSLTLRELIAYWNLWLRQAQASNDLDRLTYSHGVFRTEPDVRALARAATANKPREPRRTASRSGGKTVRRSRAPRKHR
ncbi:MAG: hypothetical protein HYR85_24695 [Planctomycetes bacterium]|nr:hypothetical protein [Planctomycetota bacterium]MBI3846719.1 hypothetical protein [Planctomycetota bacterium]